MNIITLAPKNNRKIPVFSKGSDARADLIKEYYKYCDITEVYIEEEDLNKQKEV
jgi:hypothetical protein